MINKDVSKAVKRVRAAYQKLQDANRTFTETDKKHMEAQQAVGEAGREFATARTELLTVTLRGIETSPGPY